MGNIGPIFLRGLVLTLFLAGVIVVNLPRGKKMSPLYCKLLAVGIDIRKCLECCIETEL
jgi:hypothetical protein